MARERYVWMLTEETEGEGDPSAVAGIFSSFRRALAAAERLTGAGMIRDPSLVLSPSEDRKVLCLVGPDGTARKTVRIDRYLEDSLCDVAIW